MHADTEVGATQPIAGPDRVVVGLHGAQLANHYFPLTPDASYSITISPGAPRFIKIRAAGST